MKDSLELIGSQKTFGGWHQRYRHFSRTLNCEMVFAIYLPPQAEPEAALPALYWLSGLTCTDENFMQRPAPSGSPPNWDWYWWRRIPARAQRCPRRSRRRLGLRPGRRLLPERHAGAWAAHYRMHDYVVHELPALIEAHFPVSRRRGISGHSMGGHGALVCALRNPGRYLSLSAFAPICHPSDCPWGQKAFSRYLGEDPAAWREWDACALLEGASERLPILVDQGERDDFLAVQLKPEALRNAADKAGHPLELRLQPGYDHSYYFIASFIEDHLRHHAGVLNG